MNSPYQTTFSNAILTAVFMGLVSTLLCFVYYLGYKEITGFPLSDLINVSSLIFIINTIFLVVGFIYYLFLKISRKADFFYILVIVLITAFSAWAAAGVHRSDDRLVNYEFHQLLVGIILIVGISAFAGVPFLYHNKKFNDLVL